MMLIRHARPDDFQAVRSFYHELIDTAPYTPLWEKDVFPDSGDLSDAINSGSLYIGMIENKIVSAVTACKEGDISFLNLLGVLPSFSGRGLGRQMTAFVIELARNNFMKAVRLDVLEGNIAAEKLYCSMGFRYVRSFEEYYERTGRMVFKVYELLL